MSLFLITSGVLLDQSSTQSTYQHQLRISVVYIHPEEFHQGIPLTVQFEIENIGDTIFGGKATLEMKTEKYNYNSMECQISNLIGGERYTNSNIYITDDDFGRYRTTLKIESDNIMDRISIYEGTTLKDEANRVSYETSIFVKSYETYLKEVELERDEQRLILIGIGTAITVLTFYYAYIRRKKRRR